MRLFGEKKRRGGYQGKKIHSGAVFRGGWFRRAREPLVIGRLRKEFNVALLKRFTISSRPNLRFGARSFTINSGLCEARKRTNDAHVRNHFFNCCRRDAASDAVRSQNALPIHESPLCFLTVRRQPRLTHL